MRCDDTASNCLMLAASCALIRPWEAIVIGGISAILSLLSCRLMDHLEIDDPVDAVAVHLTGGIWVGGRRQ